MVVLVQTQRKKYGRYTEGMQKKYRRNADRDDVRSTHNWWPSTRSGNDKEMVKQGAGVYGEDIGTSKMASRRRPWGGRAHKS